MKISINYKVWMLSLMAVVFLFSSCSDDNGDEDALLVEYEYRASLSVTEMQLYLTLAGLTELSKEIKYGVDIYYMEYPYEYKQTKIKASGLVCVPQSEGNSFPVLSFQHGTMVSKTEAPSLTYTGLQTKGIAGIAGAGYVVTIPDLIGFGASSDYFHPYFDKNANAQAVLSMIDAIKEIPDGDLSGVSVNDELFLTGYSQGGWITLAAVEAIEKETYEFSDWDLVGAVCGAGPYNPETVMDYVMSQESYSQPYYMPYVLLSFQESGYSIGALSKYFNEPYASDIPGLYDGTKGGGTINSSLTTINVDLYTDNFLNNFSDTEFDVIRDAFYDNKIISWQCETPLLLIHGDADVYVPKETTVEIYNELLSENSNDVQMELLPGFDHTTAAVPSIGLAVQFFNEIN